jgi:predicted flavoprotein YhiN
LGGTGLADLGATKNGQQWFIEVKTLVLQTKPQEIEFGGKTQTLIADKFQPASRNIAEYVETVSKLIAGNHIQKARKQLLNTVKELGSAKKMAAIALNLFAAPFFLEAVA